MLTFAPSLAYWKRLDKFGITACISCRRCTILWLPYYLNGNGLCKMPHIYISWLLIQCSFLKIKTKLILACGQLLLFVVFLDSEYMLLHVKTSRLGIQIPFFV
jgi:hypothetical protein